ncbi:MAG: NUDIX hydrolase [Patescibacteria group bacterium]|nr:NUDIX hydrolase [Patescibacteria group bacterium]
MKWKKLSSKTIYRNNWMEVAEDRVVTEFGKKFTFGVVRKKPFALIIPWNGRHLFLVGQYRYPVDKFSWEFPQGHFEHKSINETAKEELREETGLTAHKIREISRLFLAPGLASQICHVFLATKLSQGKRELQESEKGMKLKRATLKEFQNMIIKGLIKDSPTIAAFGIMIVKNLFKFSGTRK